MKATGTFFDLDSDGNAIGLKLQGAACRDKNRGTTMLYMVSYFSQYILLSGRKRADAIV